MTRSLILSFAERQAILSDLESGRVTCRELMTKFERQSAESLEIDGPASGATLDAFSPLPEPADLNVPDPLTTTRALVLGTVLRQRISEERGLFVRGAESEPCTDRSGSFSSNLF
jgi:hypothetical protein